MVSTFSTRYKYELPATGDLPGTWGTQVNAAITGLLDESIDAVTTIAMADANTTITIPNGVSSPNRAGTLVVNGALTATRTMTVPSGDRVLRIVNLTSGGFSINVKNPSSGTVSVSNGYMALVYFIGATAVMPSYQMPSALIASATLGSTSIGFNDGTAALPSISFSSDDNTGIYRITENQIGVSTGGAIRCAFTSSLTQFYNDVTIEKGAAAALFMLNSSTPQSRQMVFQTNGSYRWLLQTNGTAEGGGNIGSNFRIARYDDAGSALSASAFGIDRSSGNVGINSAPLTGVRLYVVIQDTEAVTDARAIRVLNSIAAADSSVSIELATSGGVQRASIRGVREGSSNHGKMVLASALGGVAQDCLTLASSLAATFTGAVTGVSFTPTSDARLKTNLREMEAPLTRLRAMKGLTFDKLGAKTRQAGVIAQDTRNVLPEAVVTTEMKAHGYDDILAVDPMALIALLIEAVKELDAQVQSSLNRTEGG